MCVAIHHSSCFVLFSVALIYQSIKQCASLSHLSLASHFFFNSVIIADLGQVLSFPGGEVVHGGDPLLSGVRYIIAVFLLLEEGAEGEEAGGGDGDDGGEGDEEYTGELVVDGLKGSKSGKEWLNKGVKGVSARAPKDQDACAVSFIGSYLSAIEADPFFASPPAPPAEEDTRLDRPEKPSVYGPPAEQSSFSFGFGF